MKFDLNNLLSIMSSKKAWACSIAVMIHVLNDMLGLGLTPETMESISYPLMAYICGQGIADIGKNKKP
jgi:hypothetical protein